MNKTALKNFATWSRRKLIEQVQTKAFLYGIDEKNSLHIEEQFGQLLINGQTYPLSMKPAFTALQKQLEQKGYKQLLEEAAYTWFNRIIAIRYMEVHEYLPERVNVLSSSVGRVDPDILFEYDTMALTIDKNEIKQILNTEEDQKDGISKTEKAYKKLFIAQCNELNSILPFMFEKIQDYSELLLPDFLLDTESVIKTLVLNEELTESFAEIEVIGWLYQYYIAEEKDRVFAQKSKYKKEEIPFATQLFTPKWIVQYMVQNSLGRYWTEAHREDEDLIDNWEYFIKHEEDDFHEKIAPYVNKELKVEDIKLLDPAMGSGHILVYAFELFHEIYEKCGYPKRDIPHLILEHNLYGLDIDDRAYQLAAFAVVMKATSYSKRFLRSIEREGIHLNLASIQETNHISNDVIEYIAQQEVGEQYNQVKAFFDQYHNAKTYGSLINITEREISFIEERFLQIENNPVEDLLLGEQHEIAKQVLPSLIHQTKIMRNEFDVVVMNPPYMGKNGMDKVLSEFLKEYYPNSKSDLFAAFMEVNQFLKNNGFYAAINQHAWMFLNSFSQTRINILYDKTIVNLVHLGAKAFEELDGEIVQTVTFILRNYKVKESYSKFIRLIDFKHHEQKRNEMLNVLKGSKDFLFLKMQEDFFQIADCPIAYWWSEDFIALFGSKVAIEQYTDTKKGVLTGKDSLLVRLWYEVDKEKIAFNMVANKKLSDVPYKWFLQTNGGKFKKWYGNIESVVDMSNNGGNIIKLSNNYRLRDPEFYFKEGITWTEISSKGISARYVPEGVIFGNGGPMAFPKEHFMYIFGLINSKVTDYILQVLAPNLNLGPDQLKKIPLIIREKEKISEYVKECIDIVKDDWDSREISIDFSTGTFSKYSNSFRESYTEYVNKIKKDINRLKELEEMINYHFIDIYNLDSILSPKIENQALSIEILTIKEYAKSFLSFFIGCLCGRFELGTTKFKSNKFIRFDDALYFDDDIINVLREFLIENFKSHTLDENITWLAEALEMKNGEDAETRIRRYFLDEFFADHCKMYQKRPIYWLVDSGKQKGLRTLIYMHRYQPDTMATIRFEHLQEIQAKYQQEIADLENRLVNSNLSATDKKKLNAEKVSFEKKIEELREFDKRLAAIAAEEIEIDLDDGVKVNYEKFYRGGKGVLAKIK